MAAAAGIGSRPLSLVARGEAALGFQQISELKPIKGIELVGPLPSEVQQITVFSAGIGLTVDRATLLRL